MQLRLLTISIALILTRCGMHAENTFTGLNPNGPYLPPLEQHTHPDAQYLTYTYRLAQTPQWRQAQKYINTLKDSGLEPYTYLIQAAIDLNKHHPRTACRRLEHITPTTLPPNWQTHYYAHLAQCQAQQNNLAKSLNALMAEQVPAQQYNAYLLTVWDTVYLASPQQLAIAKQTLQDDPTAQGWIDLALLAHQSTTQRDFSTEAITQWKTTYPNHPARPFVSEQNTAWPPKKIGLLLPMQGPLAMAGKAIQSGAFAAFYQAQHTQAHHPQTLKVYDTSLYPLNTLMTQAQQDHIDILLGPLAQKDVEALTQLEPTIPIIALNTTHTSNSNVFELNMRAEDEGRQMAEYAFKNGARNAFLISTPHTKSQRIRTAFLDRWAALGGTRSDELSITDFKHIMPQLREQLDISASQNRAKQLKQYFNLRAMRFIPQRRQDIDSIFLTLNHSEAKKTIPLLKYFYTGTLPIYATSSIYHNTSTRFRDHDLDGVTFGDTPWVSAALTHQKPAHRWLNLPRTLQHIWPKDFSQYSRFFAIGVDAYQLAFNLPHLMRFPYAYLNSATGKLYLNENNHIQRLLTWIHIRHGLARPQFATTGPHWRPQHFVHRTSRPTINRPIRSV